MNMFSACSRIAENCRDVASGLGEVLLNLSIDVGKDGTIM